MVSKKNKTIKALLTLLIIFIICLPFNVIFKQIIYAEHTSTDTVDIDELETYITDIINWKKAQMNQSDEQLLTNKFLERAGETSVDWYVIGLGRTGKVDDYDAYLAMIKEVVEERYKSEEKLSASKATEWHRISLAILSASGDPTNVGKDQEGNPINLIADGTYDRGQTTRELGAQGINGWIWGLITLDSLRYKVPDDALETRESIITEILSAQIADGGFVLNPFEKEADVDITAMAVQALAPYYNSEETYTYTQTDTGEKVTKKVRNVIDESLQVLSEQQSSSGDYDLMGMKNVESTAQVVVALTSLGIDPLQDERFIKNNHTLIDGMFKYRMSDGGFIHSETYDEENEEANPNESNSMATEQVLYTLVSLYRFYEGNRSLYDFRPEMNEEIKAKVQHATETIDNLPKQPTKRDVKEALATYEDVPMEERSYVYNYIDLTNSMKKVKVDNTLEFIAEHMEINELGNGNNITLFDEAEEQSDHSKITKEDEEIIKQLLSEEVTTENYVDVISYIDKLKNNNQKEQHKSTLEDLNQLKEAIENQEDEIDELNEIILNKLYPFHNVSIDDQALVEEIVDRYESLEEYDQEKVQGYDDVEKAATQINNLIRTRYIKISVSIVIVVMAALLVIRYKMRKDIRRKEKMMDIE